MSRTQKTPSSIIIAFTKATQQIENDTAKYQFDKLTKDLKERRKNLREQLGGGQDVDEKKQEAKAGKAERFKSMDEHRITLPEVAQRLGTDLEKGLTTEIGEAKLKEWGKNALSEKKKTPWYWKLIHEFTTVFSCLLWGGMVVAFIAYGMFPTDPSNFYLAWTLIIVIVISGSVTYFQNAKSEAIMDAFKNFIPPETTVIRNGQQQKFQAELLVPGDIIIVEYGKRIPADIRILESHEMKVDNSSLTGESMLLLRSVECTHPDNPLETKNLAFFGTLCKEGSGKGLVISTGDRTVIGQIADLVSNSGAEETTLKRELDSFIKMIAIIASCTGVVFFCLGFIIGYDAITNISFAIGILCGNIPEGLIATVTISLGLTAQKLATKKVLVKNLEGVETLGSTTCICSDKTGTLTQNKMTVENMWYNNTKIRGMNKQKMGPKFKYEYSVDEVGFKQLHECAILCSEAVFDSSLPQDKHILIMNNAALSLPQRQQRLIEATQQWNENFSKLPFQERPTQGDASETALIKFFQPIQDILFTRSQKSIAKDAEGKLCRMPFNSTNKYAFLIVEEKTDKSNYTLYSKGAPERIWGLCDKVFNNGEAVVKNEQWDKDFVEINQTFGKQGERVLGFAKCSLPKETFPVGFNFNLYNMNFPFQQQTFIGLISLIDPPKDAVPNAVLRCKAAGIQVIMVTGDQPVTAAAIAKQCNIITDKTADEIAEEEGISLSDAIKKASAIVIHGDQITKMTIEEDGLPEAEKGRTMSEWLDKPQIVFARTSPAQKLIIVAGCQKKGHVVAVTGDGVNDSPAIKKADIGIAMGISGSDVAKDAAQMILLDDDFSSIVVGIEEGRKIFDNLKKAISYAILSNIPQIYPFLIFIIIQYPPPITNFLILLICLGTDIIPLIAFVFEEPELDIMSRKPRNQSDHLAGAKLMVFCYVQCGVITSFGGQLMFFITMNDFGFPAYSMFYISGRLAIQSNDTDYFEPESPWLGNSNLKTMYNDNGGKCTEVTLDNGGAMVDFLYISQAKYDLRNMLVECGDDGKYHEAIYWGECKVNQISPITNRPVCYTTEAVKYAQTSYFFSIILCYICNWFQAKTLKLSILYSGLKNPFMYFGFTSELMLSCLVAYCVPLNIGLGTRDVTFIHYGVAAMPFGLIIILWGEARKFMIRNYPSPKPNLPNWWQRCVAL